MLYLSAAARQAAWYNDLDGGDENYNPFRKTRYRPSRPVVTLLSATQSDEAIHKGKEAVLPDTEATHANQSPVRIPTEDLPWLEVPSRPMRFMVIEYAKREDDIGSTREQ